jgi:hypothetical protein
VTRSLGDEFPLDRSFTTKAGLPGSRVDLSLILVPSVAPIGRDVVIDARAAGLDRAFENLTHEPGDCFAFTSCDASRCTTRTNAGQEERFVRVDISDPGRDTLIEKDRLDRSLSMATDVEE